MDKTIERELFNEFQHKGLFTRCVDFIEEKYDLDIYKKTPEEEMESLNNLSQDERVERIEREKGYRSFCETELPDIILKQALDFKLSWQDLLDEIESNIKECKTEEDRERYLFYILKHLKSFSDIYYPKGEISNLEEDIKIYEQRKIEIEQSPDLWSDAYDKERFIKGLNDRIVEKRWLISRIEYRKEKFDQIDKAEIERKTVEGVLCWLNGRTRRFVRELDALFLIYGTDFMRAQEECGIYLKMSNITNGLEDLIGSRKLVEKYIGKLPQSKRYRFLNYVGKASPDTREAVTYHSGEAKENLTAIFNQLKESKYFEASSHLQTWLYICGDTTQPKTEKSLNWLKDQQLLAYLVDTLFGDTDSQNIWSITQKAFTVKGKTPNTNSMKNIISKLKNGWRDRTKEFDDLDKILKV